MICEYYRNPRISGIQQSTEWTQTHGAGEQASKAVDIQTCWHDSTFVSNMWIRLGWMHK